MPLTWAHLVAGQQQCESERGVDTREQEPGIANARDRERIKAEPQAACGQVVAQAKRLSIENIVWVARRVADGAGNDLGGNHDFIEQCGVEKGIQQRVASPYNSTRDQHPAKRDTLAVMPDGIDSLRLSAEGGATQQQAFAGSTSGTSVYLRATIRSGASRYSAVTGRYHGT